MRQRDGLSWGRIATITGLPSSSIRRICTWDLGEVAPTVFGEGQPAYHGPEALPWWMSLAAESNPGITMFTRLVRDPNHELADG